MRATVDNFQSLGATTIEATGLTVIVGKSNLGKSALVRAISAALFNRAGDDFVRVGAETARVQLDDLPGVGRVTWAKGGGVNQFEVNGEVYAKVGSSTPAVLTVAGYREVAIGKETIRPQVAEQFEGLFLLDRSGAFVSDALSVLSHLGTLLKADRTCGLDLKRQKALLTVRVGDLELERRKFASLDPVAALHTRVTQLGARIAEVRAMTGRLATIQALLTRRTSLHAVLARRLPAVVERPLTEVDTWAERLRVVRAALRERSRALDVVFETTAAAKSARQEVEHLKSELDTALTELKVCPLCERAM